MVDNKITQVESLGITLVNDLAYPDRLVEGGMAEDMPPISEAILSDIETTPKVVDSRQDSTNSIIPTNTVEKLDVSNKYNEDSALSHKSLTSEDDGLSIALISVEGSPVIAYLESLNLSKLNFYLNSTVIAINKEALESDVILLDLISDNTYSVGQMCQRFDAIPVIALLPEGYDG